METVDILRTVAVAAAFACAALGMPVAVATFQRLAVAGQVDASATGARTGAVARVVRNGFGPATALARVFMGHPRVAAYCDAVAWLARQRGYVTDAARMGGVVAIFALAVALLGWLASSSAAFGFAAALCLILAFGALAHRGREKWAEAMRDQVPDALHAMSACFHAGYSLLQTFRHLAAETPEPLGALFRRAAGELETGKPASEVLESLRARAALPELAFVAVALEVQHQAGGGMQKVIDSASDSVEAQIALRRMLRVQTAQARLSARIVAIMPFALIAVFSLASPGFLAPFFSSAAGVAVLCLALAMQGAGIVAVRRMLDLGED